MRTTKYFFALFFIAALLAAGDISAQAPRSFSYQGMLLDASRQPVTGQHTITVKLYNAPLEGVVLHSETFATTLDNGVFSVIIGSQTALGTSVKFDEQYWLGISVDGSDEMLPRTALTSSPYANALTTGAVTSINDMSGELNIVGGAGLNVETNGNTITLSSMLGTAGGQTPQESNVVHGLTGTENQVLVDGTFGIEKHDDLILTLPQDIHTGATPTFEGMTLTDLESGSSSDDVVVSNNGVLETRSFESISGGLDSENPFITFDADAGDLDNNRVLTAGDGISITDDDEADDGTLTIGNTGVLSITGTANQVNADVSTGDVTLSLPQDIDADANPTFDGMTLSDFSTGVVHSDGSGLLSSSEVVYGDIQDVSAARLLGNPTGSSATMSEISLGYGLQFDGSSLETYSFAMGNEPFLTFTSDLGSLTDNRILGNSDGSLALTIGASDNDAADIILNTAHANSWTALQTFSSVDINGGTIDGTTIGASVPAPGTFTTLTVTGTSDLQGAVSSSVDDLDITDDVQITGSLTVNTNTDLNGTLDVDGATTLNSTLDVDGATTLNNTLDVDGATTLNNTLDVDGATTLNSTLDVDGATTLNSTLDVDGATTLNSTVDVDGATTLNSTLDVDGATTLNSTLDVDGATTLNNTLDVDGATTLNSTVDVDGATTLNSTLDVDGATTLNSTLDVDGATTLNNTLDVDGATTLNNTLDVDGATTLNASVSSNIDDLDITDDVQITGNLNVNTNTDLDGTLNVDGNTSLNANISSINDDLDITDDVEVTGSVDINTNLNVDGTSSLNAAVSSAVDDLDITDDVEVTGSVDINTNLNVDGTSSLNAAVSSAVDDLDITDDVEVTGSVDINTNLNVDGTSSLNGAVSSAVDDLDLNDDVQISGNTDIDGTLNVDGTVHFGTHLDVDGNLNVDGTSSLNSAVSSAVDDLDIADDVEITGSVDINTNLNVDGTSSLNSAVSSAVDDLDITDDVQITGSLTVNTNTDLDGTLNVDGTSSLNAAVSSAVDDLDIADDVEVTGSVDINTNLNVDGTSSLNGNVSSAVGDLDIVDDVQITGSLNVNTNTDLDGSLNVDGSTTLNAAVSSNTDDLDITDDVQITGSLNVNTNTDLDGTLNVDGSTTLNAAVSSNTDDLDITDDVQITGNTDLDGTLNVDGSIAKAVGSLWLNDNVDVTGNAVPTADNTYDLGSDLLRWKNVYVNGSSIHVGPTGGAAGNTEMTLGYAAGTGSMNINGGTSELSVSTSAATMTNVNLWLANNDASARELRLYESSADGGNYSAFKSQAQATNITYTLPADDGGADDVLLTDGAGNLNWGQVTTSEIALNTILANDIATGAVESDEILDNTITVDDIGPNAVGNSEMIDNAIGNAEMLDNAIGNAEMLDNAIGNAEMADNAIGNAEMADNAIGNAEMADNAVGNAEMADNAVGSAEITNGSVTYADIQNVTDARLLGRSAGSNGTMQEITIGSGLTLTGGQLSSTGNVIQGPDVQVVGDAATIDADGVTAVRVLSDGDPNTDVLTITDGINGQVLHIFYATTANGDVQVLGKTITVNNAGPGAGIILLKISGAWRIMGAFDN